MRTIIAGGRDISDTTLLEDAIEATSWEITEVVCGRAKGVDTMGENWAVGNGIPVKPFPAKWKNFDLPGAVRKKGRYGDYNATAGHHRNEQMAEYADAIILIWDGKSRGSGDMKRRAAKHGLVIHEMIVGG